MTNRPLLFSQREGYLEIPEPLRLEELPKEVRLEIELCLIKAIELYQQEERFGFSLKRQSANWHEIMRDIWVQVLGEPVSYFQGLHHVQSGLMNTFHNGEFFDVFDIIEELVNRSVSEQPKFCEDLKEVFGRRRMAYSLVGSDSCGFAIIPTTNDLEVLTVKTTFDLLSIKAPLFDDVIKHLLGSGRLLREGKDGKSIGESSSAIESVLRILTSLDKEHNLVAKEYFKIVTIHPIIKQLIEKPYQFASDISDGRHSAKQGGYVADNFDSQYIFTICCSTVQYLINKQKLKN